MTDPKREPSEWALYQARDITTRHYPINTASTFDQGLEHDIAVHIDAAEARGRAAGLREAAAEALRYSAPLPLPAFQINTWADGRNAQASYIADWCEARAKEVEG